MSLIVFLLRVVYYFSLPLWSYTAFVTYLLKDRGISWMTTSFFDLLIAYPVTVFISIALSNELKRRKQYVGSFYINLLPIFVLSILFLYVGNHITVFA